MTVTLYMVGGAVRDDLMGVPSKDIDFSVEAGSFMEMKVWLVSQGFTIFTENPEFLTVRARFPKAGFTFGNKEMARQTCDFVLARKDGAYTDGRRPDEVIPGTILDDLARRDFTMNAIARTAEGTLIDPFGGRSDIARRGIVAVGEAEDRIREDALRGLRAIRFAVTKGFWIDGEIAICLRSKWFAEALSSVSTERIREEMFKAFKADTPKTLAFLQEFPQVCSVVFNSGSGLWLKPTMED